ncbi:hypothetical protein K488DRAFT_46775 [Vararia minispora EC-137]|uniref:Uncharacterized protein n=1 Tax=Vararia minispora EC-137 TaxID=1314806 RepID=A0ACB8QQA4_9AGAM|nr:hypothetical protein K488DRAFT_46775 [Vararia minispora EC-137]
MPLFEGVRYALTSSLTAEERIALRELLETNGAGAAPLSEATHVIASDLEFDGKETVAESAALVTREWVDRSYTQDKQLSIDVYSPHPDKIFSGVVACADEGIPQSDVEVLSAGINALGGAWRAGLTKEVTHLFANSAGSDKYHIALHYAKQFRVKVVLPQWFDDAVRFGARGTPTIAYEWPDPPLLETLRGGNYVPPPPRPSITLAGPAKKVWEGRRVLLAPDLDLQEGRRQTVELSIVHCGGIVAEVDNIDAVHVLDYDVLIARHRWGHAYVQAVREGKLVGTLAWLIHVQATGSVSKPTDHLLHYPIPRKPIPGFAKHHITVTNYQGAPREYLKRLIELAGATFTPTLSNDSSAVVAASLSGTKADRARSWHIPIVNKAWLEDCFAAWRALPVTAPSYAAFPPAPEVAPPRALDERVIRDEAERVADEVARERRARAIAESEGEDEDEAMDVDMQEQSADEGETGRAGASSGAKLAAPRQRSPADEADEQDEDEEDRDEDEDAPAPRRDKGKKRAKLQQLGVRTASSVKDCTHLIVNRIARTEKFLCAIAGAPVIVDEFWARECAAQKKILHSDEFRLKDRETEKKFRFRLSEALRRARENEGQLFEDMTFYITQKIPVDMKLLKNVILAHGGKFKQQNPTARVLDGKTDHYVISCDEDISIWRPLSEAGYTIYTTELILTSALVQEIRWKDPINILR